MNPQKEQEDAMEEVFGEELDQEDKSIEEIKSTLIGLNSNLNKCLKAITTNQKYISEFKMRIEKLEDDFKLLLEENDK